MEKDIKKIKEEKKPSSKHLFAYLRVSTLKQEIENQTSEIKRYCQKHNLGTIPEAR
jgi:predicted site-specific integrase-resolvase